MRSSTSLLFVILSGLSAPEAFAQGPQIAAGGVLNAASLAAPGVLAPGVILSVFGTSLSDGTTAMDLSTQLPTRLAGARLLVNGIAAPLIYASPKQINAQFPVELAATTAVIQVEVQSANGTFTSPSVNVSVASYSPGLFTLDQNGSGPGTIFRASDFSAICPPGRHECTANPAIPGEVVTIYMTGLGTLTRLWSSGQAAQTATPTVVAPLVTIGGIQAQVLFSGLASSVAGLYQVDVIVPPNAPTGDSLPVIVTIGELTSNPVTISIGTVPVPKPGESASGENINVLVVDPINHYTVYAGTDGGVFKSTNGGASWTVAKGGIYVFALAIDPVNPATVYAGSNNGVFKSTNRGEIWIPVSGGMTGGDVSSLAIDRSNPAIVYVGTHGGGQLDGAYKSTDGGSTWTAIKNGQPRGVSAMTISPSNPNILYASTNATGTFKTTDGGASWGAVNSGLGIFAVALAIDPVNPDIVYAGSYGSGVFKTTNGGANWSPANSGIGNAIHLLVVDPLNPATVYAGTTNGGVFKTSDGGASWTQTNSGSSANVSALAIDPINPATLYVATKTGFFKSADGGTNWQPIGSN